MLTFAEALAGEDTINHPISAGSQVLRGRIPATSSFFELSVWTNESWAVATASSEQQPCDASKRCEGGLGEQLSVQGRRRIARSTESGRSTHRAKASARARGENDQPAALRDVQLERSAVSSRRGDVPFGQDDSSHPFLRH